MESKYHQESNNTESIHHIYKVSQDKKYELFNSWCAENGVKIPKLEYPAVFDGGLLGARAAKDIEHREAFLFIPFKMLLSLEYVHNHPVLKFVVKENPQLFNSERHDDWEQLTLALGMMYEY